MAMIRKILVVTDTWHPEVNGVVRTWNTTLDILTRQGYQVEVIEPSRYRNFPFPFYPDIRVAWPSAGQIQRTIDQFGPDAIHIATEGTLGLAVRNYCTWRRLRFTTSYHTRSPEYLERLAWFPSSLTYAYLRWFHSRSQAIMVAAPSIEAELNGRGFRVPIVRWSRDVNLDLFHQRRRTSPQGKRPILLSVGRVSREKNLEAFLSLKCAGTKVVVGDGPHRQALREQFSEAVFPGKLQGEALAQSYADADLFVFPSKTDTFGLVIIEALASGVPVAAYPVPGPIDILTNPKAGAMDEDLGRAVETALRNGDPRECVALAQQYTWERSSWQFVANLVPARPTRTLLFPGLYPSRKSVSARAQ
jgi:1,2-diacylglycerol 3-alpha-glucosyltransferase/glucuronosyltransferase